MIRTLRSLVALSIIVRSPNEWASWARDTSRVFGDSLARALGEPPPPGTESGGPLFDAMHYASHSHYPGVTCERCERGRVGANDARANPERAAARRQLVADTLEQHGEPGLSGRCRCGWVAPHGDSIRAAARHHQEHRASSILRALDLAGYLTHEATS